MVSPYLCKTCREAWWPGEESIEDVRTIGEGEIDQRRIRGRTTWTLVMSSLSFSRRATHPSPSVMQKLLTACRSAMR